MLISLTPSPRVKRDRHGESPGDSHTKGLPRPQRARIMSPLSETSHDGRRKRTLQVTEYKGVNLSAQVGLGFALPVTEGS